jgi:hypothetical protein
MFICLRLGDVLSGTSTTGVHHSGIFEGWFGPHVWNSRPIVLLATTLLVFAPLVSFKRLGKYVRRWKNKVQHAKFALLTPFY